MFASVYGFPLTFLVSVVKIEERHSNITRNKQEYPHLYRFQHFNHAGVPEGTVFANCIFREGQAGFICCNIKGKYTA